MSWDGLLAYAVAVWVFVTGMRLTACFRSSGMRIAVESGCLVRRDLLHAYPAAVPVLSTGMRLIACFRSSSMSIATE
eukprot:COSAG02_NODE_55528_length_290_cov_0.722513_1_plen_76_part_10